MRVVTASLAVEHWYTNGTALGMAGFIVGILGIVLAVILWRFGAPRGLLEYSMSEPRALVSRSSPMNADELEVKFRNVKVENPYLTTVRLVNHGNRDIRSDDFDQGKPVILNLNVHIIDILTSSLNAGHLSLEQDKLLIPPVLIRRNEEISADLLTEGAPDLTCEQSLADVKVRLDSKWNQPPLKSYAGLMGTSLIAGLGLNIIEYSPKGQNEARGAGLIIPVMGVSMSIIAFKRLDRSYRRNRGTSTNFRIMKKRKTKSYRDDLGPSAKARR